MSPIDTRLRCELFPVFLNERWEPVSARRRGPRAVGWRHEPTQAGQLVLRRGVRARARGRRGRAPAWDGVRRRQPGGHRSRCRAAFRRRRRAGAPRRRDRHRGGHLGPVAARRDARGRRPDHHRLLRRAPARRPRGLRRGRLRPPAHPGDHRRGRRRAAPDDRRRLRPRRGRRRQGRLPGLRRARGAPAALGRACS